jgi:Zn finger protein HypA/HybF involved in hydrogenase expression
MLIKNSRPNIKCPTCNECLDSYTSDKGKIYLYCWLCNRIYSLLPGRKLKLAHINISQELKVKDE